MLVFGFFVITITSSKFCTFFVQIKLFCLFTTMRKQESLKTPAKCNLA